MADPKILSDLSIAPIEVNQSAPASMTRTGIGQGMRGNFSNVRQGLDRLGRANAFNAGTTASGGNISSLRFPADTPKYYFQISVSEFGGYNALGGGPGSVAFNTTGTYVLPIPYPLNDTQEIEYSEYPFGPAWGTALNAANQTGAVNEFAGGLAGGDLEGITNGGTGMVEGLINGLPEAGAGALAGVTPQAAQNVVGAFGGFAVNQFYTVLLKGPKYKRYQLSWDLAPRTSGESLTIKNIIKELRRAAAPGVAGAGGLIWDFPYIVMCTFRPQGNGVDTMMYRFKPAVMEAVSADYAPFGKPGFYKGTDAPESVRLTIQFLEIEYWVRENF